MTYNQPDQNYFWGKVVKAMINQQYFYNMISIVLLIFEDELFFFTRWEMRRVMAANKALRFKIGDWIVHNNYGVGEVVDIVEKVLDGQPGTFFKVSTQDIDYWLPSDKADADHITPIRSEKEFDQALQIISEPPVKMSEPPSRHKRLIYERWLDGSLAARAALIRDLHGMDRIKKLSYDEKKTYDRAEIFFLNEWIISDPSLTISTAKKRLKDALNLSSQMVSSSTKTG